MNGAGQPCARGHAARAHVLDGGVREPAWAEHGLLCADCYRRLEYRLDDIPDLIGAAREDVVRGVVHSGGSEPVSGTKERLLPFDVHAVEVADDLFSMLSNWTLAAAAALGEEPPASLGAVAAADANVHGLTAYASPSEASGGAERIARWLRAHLEALAGLPMIVDLFDELVPAVERAHGRWGVAGPKQRRRALPCPSCGGDVVRVGWNGHRATVWCSRCLHQLPTDWSVLS